MKKTIIASFIIFFSLSASAVTRYVRPTASGTGSGNSWANASSNIQTMINASSSGDQVWVASGTYFPSSYPSGCTNCSSIRDYTFFLKNGVKLYGGFVGTETNISQRNIRTNPSILSGGTSSPNSYHVVLALDVNSLTEINGFTIRDGLANSNTSLAITTSAGARTILKNQGGGMFCQNSNAGIVDCTFLNNFSSDYGGGVELDNSDPLVLRCIFSGNISDYGGGIDINNSDLQIINCLYHGNRADYGGGIGIRNSISKIIHSTLTGNSASINAGGIYTNFSTTTIQNTIVWANNFIGTGTGVSEIGYSSGQPTVEYSIVQNGYNPCLNCLNTLGNIDPQFVNRPDPNGADNIWGTTDDGLALSLCSPALENGGGTIVNTNADFTGTSRAFDIPFKTNANYGPGSGQSFTDIGAFEKQESTAPRLYVNIQLTTGLNDGSSWANAFRGATPLQSALTAAAASCEGNEIWVAKGTYIPSAVPTGCTGCTENRDKTFFIKDGISIFGGFAGTETTLNQRIVNTNETVLDGELGTLSNLDDNAFHVVLSISPTKVTLDRLTIKNGGTQNEEGFIIINSTNYDRNKGGGIQNRHAPLTLNTCKIDFNRASNGGGLYHQNNILTLQSCDFTGNTVINAGGAIFMSSVPISSKIENSQFHSNLSNLGGAIYQAQSSADFTNCTFKSNRGEQSGGACNNFENTITSYINCTFFQNYGLFGAALSTTINTEVGLFNCTFFNNTATTDFGVSCFSSNLIIFNSIFWREGISSALPVVHQTGTPNITINRSIIEGGFSPCISCPNSNGNINPQFVSTINLSGPDNKFQTADDGLALKNISPAINAGISSSFGQDYLNNTRIGAFDIGAFEYMSSGSCPQNRYMTDIPIETGSFLAERNIQSTGTAGSSNLVQMRAGNSVLLLPGFQTQNNTIFIASIGGCPPILLKE